MLEKYFVRPETVDRIRSSWIGGAIERYVDWLTEQNYAVRNMSKRVPILMRFGEFARVQGATRWDELGRYVKAFAEFWVKEHGKGCKTVEARKKVAHDAQNPVQQMLRLIIPNFAAGGRTKTASEPFQFMAPGFCDYLREERGLRDASIHHYRFYLGQFERYLKKIDLHNLFDLSPVVLSAFTTDQTGRLAKTTLRDRCGVLRVFLRYLYRERVTPKDLSNTVEFPHIYRLSNIPRSITWNEVHRILEAVERRTPIGRRDYAILLLLVTYGLRAREVAALTLDDIDWRRERLIVPERKAGHSTAFPLSKIVGTALLDYLKQGRPKLADRHVFFRGVAPYKPLTHIGVSVRATHYLHKAGISVPRAGSHTLRHTCAQRLVDANFPLKTIGDYLGHRVPSSTAIYSKVAIETLREVACGDGEEIL